MNLLEKFWKWSKVFALAAVFSLFLFAQNATAQNFDMSSGTKMFSIPITQGKFDVDVPGIDVKDNFRVDSVIVSLPEGETGIIEEIVIIGPDNQREYGCVNQKVKNGVDLIKSCGGFAYLKKGSTVYQAKGSNFNPNRTIQLGVELSISESEA